MQRAELEEARQREANETALLAIGPRKKLKTSVNQPINSSLNNLFTNSSSNALASTLPFSNNIPKTPVSVNKLHNKIYNTDNNNQFCRSFFFYSATSFKTCEYS